MSCCCSEVVVIGCFDACEEIALGYDATDTGAHVLEIQMSMNAVQVVLVNYVDGDEMTIPAGTLNESSTLDFRIKMPDGSYYEFADGVDCGRITTQVHYSISELT